MSIISVFDFVEFTCVGSDCPISCCGGAWGIPIDNESMKYYKSIEGDFGNILREGIEGEDNTYEFKLNGKTRDCVFLDKDKLCMIYKNLGPDALCFTCSSYPRMTYQVGDITVGYLTNSCPEVNRILFQRTTPLSVFYDDTDDSHKNGDKKIADAKIAFMTGMNVMQNKSFPLKDRLYLILFYFDRLQELVRDNNNISDLLYLFSNSELYTQLLNNRVTTEFDFAGSIRAFLIVYKSLMAEAYDHPMWVKCSELANDLVSNKEFFDSLSLKNTQHDRLEATISNELEQLIIYRYFAVMLRGFENIDYFDKFTYEIIMYNALLTYITMTETLQNRPCTQDDRILFYSLCGRIEHSETRKEKLIKELKENGFYEIGRLIKIIS